MFANKMIYRENKGVITKLMMDFVFNLSVFIARANEFNKFLNMSASNQKI